MQLVNSLPSRLSARPAQLSASLPLGEAVQFGSLSEPPKTTVDTKILKLKPKPSKRLMKILNPGNRILLKHIHKIKEIEVKDADKIKNLMADGYQVLINPNHPGHGDVFLMQELANKVGTPFCYMAASWLFKSAPSFMQKMWQGLLAGGGLFPVNQEFNDESSKHTAYEVVKDGKAPLVLFPEGILSWQNERISFVQHGAGSIATEAAYALLEEHKLNPDQPLRKVAMIPVGIKHTYTKNIIWALDESVERLEEQLRIKTKRLGKEEFLSIDGLVKRAEKIWTTMLDAKEQEFTGSTAAGKADTLVERHQQSLEHFTQQIIKLTGVSVDEKLPYTRKDKLIRAAIYKDAEIPGKVFADKKERAKYLNEEILPMMDFAFALNKLHPDYMSERPSQDRLAETLFLLDRLLNGKSDLIRKLGDRKSIMQVGEPIDLTALIQANVKPEEMNYKDYLRPIKGQVTDKLKDSLVTLVNDLTDKYARK